MRLRTRPSTGLFYSQTPDPLRQFLNMRWWSLPALIACVLLVSLKARPDEPNSSGSTNEPKVRTFAGHGVVEELKLDELVVVIRHEAISNYMAAMTMPFKVKTPALLAAVRTGDEILFQLHVTDVESWIDHLQKIGTVPVRTNATRIGSSPVPVPAETPLLDCKFTNELGQAVSLNDFHGQALAITFFYTRCPLPDYCPRLSKNFEEASEKLRLATNAPSNWHLL